MTQAVALARDAGGVGAETTSYVLVGPAGTAVGVAGAVVALAACLAILATGHLDEDAYILLTYSQHLATGHGIVWDLAHGPAEGATDFLWMVLIAGLRFAHIDVGAAASLLNAAGFLMSYVAISGIARLRGLPLHLLLAGALLLSHITAASLGGFSTHFYCGVFALACYFAVRQDYRRLAFALLTLGLVRPDGLILAIGITAVVAATEWRALRAHAVCFGIAAALAVTYFLWRWQYFGLLLPLPLLVKGHTLNPLYGLRWNVLPLLPLMGVLALIVWQRRLIGHRLAVLAGGPLLLFVSLSLANQMQNLGFRFQAPITLALLTLGFCVGNRRPMLLAAALVPWLAFGVRAIDREVTQLILPDYVNYFPQRLNPLLGSAARVALTEAGRFGFRLDAVKLDIVGLNSKITATGGERVRTLAQFQPDLIFEHLVWTLDTSRLDTQRDWIELSREQYLALPVRDSAADPYHTDPTHLAAMAVRDFIAESAAQYRIYAVQYRSEFSHFYFIRGGGKLRPAGFEQALQDSFRPAAIQPHCAYSDEFPCALLAAPATSVIALSSNRNSVTASRLASQVLAAHNIRAPAEAVPLDIEANRAARKYTRGEQLRRVAWSFGRWLVHLSPHPCYAWRRWVLRLFGAQVGRDVRVAASTHIYMPWNVQIGDWAAIGPDVFVYSLGKVRIGRRATLSYRTHVCAGTHDFTDPAMPLLKPSVTIDDDAWVGTDAYIGPGVTVGRGSMVAARAVVVKDVEPQTLVGGHPARLIGQRPVLQRIATDT